MPIHYHLIIPHPSEKNVLLVSSGNGWTLPNFRSEENHFWQDVAHINVAMREQLGLAVTVLRAVHLQYDEATETSTQFYGLEIHNDAEALPSRTRWGSVDDLTRDTLPDPAIFGLIEQWTAWLDRQDQTPKRPPWYKTGWFEEAQDWMVSTLTDMDIRPVGPVEQLRAWNRSAILRVPTDQGAMYMKSVPDMFGHETRLTARLAELFPHCMPTYTAIDHEQNRIVTGQYTGMELAQCNDIRQWEKALRQYAQIQIDIAARSDTLLTLGCPDRRPAYFPDEMDLLINDQNAMIPGPDTSFSRDHICSLNIMLPQLKDQCHRLAEYDIPATLEHGDFHDRQIFVSDAGLIFTDWSDSSLSHPFFSLYSFLAFQDFDYRLPDVPDVKSRLYNAYLEPWTAYAPMDRLREALDTAQKLAPMHFALLYYRIILPGMEQPWEMHYMIPAYLDWLLAHQSG